MTVDPHQSDSNQTEPSADKELQPPSDDHSAPVVDGVPSTRQHRSLKIGSQREEPSPSDGPDVQASDSAMAADAAPAESSGTVAAEVEPYFPQPEVKQVPSDLEDEIAMALGDKSLDELIASQDASTQGESLEPDTRLQAKVVKIHREDVFFSLGGRDEGIVPLKQFSEPPDINSTFEVIVTGHNTDEGLYELSIPGAAVDVGDWSDISEGMIVEAKVTGHNSGGLECDVNNLRGFIPVSQISLFRVEDMEQFADERLQCVVVEANPMRRNLVLSHRAVLEREKESARQKLLDELEVGQLHEGVVRKIQDFGAFVDLGGVDGLVHISRLSWDRVNHPSDVLKEGQQIKVKVEKIDVTTGKIGLSYRDTTVNPWENVETKYFVGANATGAITRIAKFGAFVRLEPGVEGLIHISELAHQRVQKVSNVVQEGQEVEVKVLAVDRESQRMSLSLKALSEVMEESAGQGADEVSEPTVPEYKGELKGGTNRSSGGEQFGLKW